MTTSRRQFLRRSGISAAALPFLSGLPSLVGAEGGPRKQRVLFIVSPNGTIPPDFWPDEEGADFKLKRILQPLAEFKDRMLVIKGVSNKVRGKGDSHMRGMSCLLTGTELMPGNIMGGGGVPAGWGGGISIDQELKNFLQSKESTRTRFGSLEVGVAVPNRADPWTRWSYSGANKPVAPVDDPYQLFQKLYGSMQGRDSLASIFDEIQGELKTATRRLSPEDRALLDEHVTLVRAMEKDLEAQRNSGALETPAPNLEPGILNENDNIPTISRMQINMIVNAFANDMSRIATLQYMRSVGNARMRWLDIDDSHHGLSHEKDANKAAQEKLVKINRWFAGEYAYLAKRLAETPEPGGNGSMLDHTTIVWTNELGKGNSHTLDNIPFVLLGNGSGFKMGRSLKLAADEKKSNTNVAHNRLWMALAHSMGHDLKTFGKPDLCEGGALDLA
ncbi:MAG: DUF1552 domain-containing protein [Verrucomicrobiota bacterium]